MSTSASSAAAVSLLLGAGAFAAWILLQPEEGQPDPLRIGGASTALVAAASPDIGALSSYDCNDANPFIPLHERDKVREAIRIRKTTTAPPPVRKLAPPTTVIVTPPSEPDLPTLDAAAANLPKPMGILVLDGKPQVHIGLPGHDDITVMSPGETIDGWTLIAVENGISARMRSPEGATHALPIAVGAAVATSANGTGAPPAPAKPTGGGKNGGKMNVDAGQMAQLSKWLTPQTIDAILARPDKDQVLQQIATRLGGNMTSAEVEAMARQIRDAKAAQTAAPQPAPQQVAPGTGPRPPPGRPKR